MNIYTTVGSEIRPKAPKKIFHPNFFLWGGVFKVRGRFLSNYKTLVYQFSIYLPYIKLKGKNLRKVSYKPLQKI